MNFVHSWEDVDLANRQITIKRAISRGGKETQDADQSADTANVTGAVQCSAQITRHGELHITHQLRVLVEPGRRPMNPDLLPENLQKVLRDKLQIHWGSREDGLHSSGHLRQL